VLGASPARGLAIELSEPHCGANGPLLPNSTLPGFRTYREDTWRKERGRHSVLRRLGSEKTNLDSVALRGGDSVRKVMNTAASKKNSWFLRGVVVSVRQETMLWGGVSKEGTGG